MKKAFYFVIIVSAVLAVACGNKDNEPKDDVASKAMSLLPTADPNPLPDDNTIYGLACDGCTDSVVYLLLEDGSDPIKFDIIEAYKKNHVLGHLKVGDNIGVVRNKKDSTKADYVIDIDELKGTWCYKVMPKLRVSEEATEADKERIMAEMTDSMKELYFVEREYGFVLKRKFVMDNIGFVDHNSSTESPVMYPPRGIYIAWHLLNGKVVMTRIDGINLEDIASIKKKPTVVHDTISIDFLSDDSLTLSADGVSRTYYRLANAKDANKLANQKAQELKEAEEKQMTEGKH